MKKRNNLLGILGALVFIVLLLLLSTHFIKHPTQTKVGILALNDNRSEKIHGLKDTLSELGYIEGQNIAYEVLDAKNDPDKLVKLAIQLVDSRPDILIATGTLDARHLKELTSKLKNPPPVIFLGTLSPVEIGLVKAFTHPGTNITGLANFHVELAPKRLELLHKLLPEIKSVGLLEDPRTLPYTQAKTNLQSTANTLGISLKSYQISSSEEIQPVIKRVSAEKNEAILVLSGFFIETSMEHIIENASNASIPVFGIYPSDAKLGCLASYGTSYYDQGSQGAYLVQQVLRGHSPSEIPIETPDKLNFIVNLRAARNLGLNLNPAVLSFADEIIQP